MSSLFRFDIVSKEVSPLVTSPLFSNDVAGSIWANFGDDIAYFIGGRVGAVRRNPEMTAFVDFLGFESSE